MHLTMTSPAEVPMLGVQRLAESSLPTEFGTFRFLVYRSNEAGVHPSLSNEHVALVRGDVSGAHALPVRVHSECLTGEVFSSMKCDCRAQLLEAQRFIQSQERGCILYLRQEGRGIGLANKIRAYALQDQGANTIEANEQLNLPVDARGYGVAAAILADLGVASVKLLTNNPEKLEAMAEHGVRVVGRLPLVIQPNEHSLEYLRVKREQMNHLLPSVLATPPKDEQD